MFNRLMTLALLTLPGAAMAADKENMELTFSLKPSDEVPVCEVTQTAVFNFGEIRLLGKHYMESTVEIQCSEDVDFAVHFEEQPEAQNRYQGSFYKDDYVEAWAGTEYYPMYMIPSYQRSSGDTNGCWSSVVDKVSVGSYGIYPIAGEGASTKSSANACFQKTSTAPDGVYTINLHAILDIRKIPAPEDIAGLTTSFEIPISIVATP